MNIKFDYPSSDSLSKEYYLRNNLTLKGIERGIKLKLLEGYEWKPIGEIDRKKIKFIKNEFPNDVLSGSSVLSIFFDLQRNIEDIDIISQNIPQEVSIWNSYPEEILLDYVGSKNFKIRQFMRSKIYRVDFFKYDPNYIIWNGIKLQNPLEIIQKKINIIRESKNDIVKEKHSLDLEIIGMKVIYEMDVKRRGYGGHPKFCIKY